MRWAVGVFCTAIGVLMLVVPHQFTASFFDAIRPILLWYGIATLLAGVGFLLVALMRLRRWVVVAAHVFCGVVLLLFALMLFRGGSLTGGPLYLVLGLGTLLTGLVAPQWQAIRAKLRGDLFALMMGLCAIGVGVVMLSVPDQFSNANYDRIRPLLWLFGLVYLFGGLALVLIQLFPPRQRWLFWLPHALIACAFLGYMLLVSAPNGSLSGVVFYGGFGLLLLLLPWVGDKLASLDASLLRVRLSLTLVAVAAIPLTIVVAVITTQQERIALTQTLSSRQLFASTLANGIADYIRFHRSAAVALAGEPELLRLTQPEQQARLAQMNGAYPDFYNCSLFNAEGRGLARSDGQRPTFGAGLPVFEELRRTGQPYLEFGHSALTQQPVIAFGAPVIRDDAFEAAIICSMQTARLASVIGPLNEGDHGVVSVVDANDRVITVLSSAEASFANLAAHPPVQALREKDRSGALRFRSESQELIAGYAPISDIDWGVIVERSLAQDLSAVRGARELAFWLLLLAIGVAAFAGVLVSRLFTAPLDALTSAVARFGAGDAGAPLPHGMVSELDRVSAAFDQMRRDLTLAAAAREDAINQRDTFFSVAAHELKTPLTAMLGQAQLLQRRMRRSNAFDEKQRHSADVVVAQAERLSVLVGDLLDLSRMQQGRLTLAQEQLDLAALVQRVVDEIQLTSERHHLRYESAIHGPLLISGDAIRLEQVLHNLIGNAIKYSPHGGEVTVTVGHEDGWACLSVADRGLGIAADALPHLFERFYRAPDAVSHQIGGMGVGLFVVREIVTMHGGDVSATSVEGEGSRFTVRLPLVEA
jgi:signal transduction histidine kinase